MATRLNEPAPAAASETLFHWWLDEVAAALRAAVRRRARRAAAAAAPPGWACAGGVPASVAGRSRSLGVIDLPPPLPALVGAPSASALPPGSRELVDLLAARRVPAVLVLDAEEGLLCQDLLPAVAEAELARIMPHRVDLLTPWTPDRVHHGYRIAGKRKDGQVEVLLGAVPRATIDPILARLSAYGVSVDAVDLLGEDGDPSGLNLLGTRPARRGGRVWRVVGLVAGLVLVAGAALAGVEVYQLQGELGGRERYADALEQRLADLPQLEAQLAALKREAGFVPAQQQRTPSPIVLLEALSRLLPDSVWLDTVSVEDGEVMLSGYAEDAAQVLPIIESSPHFGAAQFRAPSTRVTVPGPGGGTREVERFSLSAKVNPTAGAEP